MATITIGYVDVTTARSTTPVRTSYPLEVELAFGITPPWWDAPDAPASLGPFLTFLATNHYTVGSASTQLFVGAAVRRSDNTGQTIEIAIAAKTPLPDAEVIVRVNTSMFTTQADYTALPTPRRGESFVVVGSRSNGTGPLPSLDYIVGTNKNPDPGAVDPDTATNISVRGPFQQPTALIVGQRREPTGLATFTTPAIHYRRAKPELTDTNSAGLLLDVTVTDATSTGQTWLHVDITQPDTADGPPRAVQPVANPAAGSIPQGQHCTYQVSWVHGTWTGSTAHEHRESSPTPVSDPVSTTTGSLGIPLPEWQDPHDPALLPGDPPPQVVAWRIYRTISGATAGGDAYLVHTEPAPVTAVGDLVPGHTWVDTVDDASLTQPQLTALRIRFRQTLDHAATQAAGGFTSMVGRLDQASYEEDGSGDPHFRGASYTVNLTGTPPTADIGYTTRPAPGRPRVTWTSRATNGTPHGVDTAAVTITPTGLAIGVDDTIDAGLAELPPDFGVDWAQRGPDRVRVEIGQSADTSTPLPHGVGMVVARVAGMGSTHPAASPRTLNVELLPGDLSFTARHLRRLRLLLGLPRPVDPTHAIDGDGLVAELELDAVDGVAARSLRLRRDTPGTVESPGTSRLVVRVGDLPDSTVIDVRPGNPFPADATPPVPLAARLDGRMRRVSVLYQGGADLAPGSPGEGQRRDGAWVTLPSIGAQTDLSIDSTTVTVAPSQGLRVDASLRSTTGLGKTDPIHLVQGSVSSGGDVKVVLPQADGRVAASAGVGVSGRVAVSSRALDVATPDHLLAVRATPQARLAFRRVAPPAGAAPAAERRVLDDATFRWLGLLSADKPADAAPPVFTGTLSATRTNTAVRGQATLTDDRITPSTWELARGRLSDLPESITVAANTTTNEFQIDLNRRGGRLQLVAQPPHVPSSGWAAGAIVGVGYAQADVEALPTSLHLDLLGGANPQQASPFNTTPDATWIRSGFRIQSDGELVVRGLQLIDVSYVRPSTFPSDWYDSPLVPPTAFWSQTAATIVKISSSDSNPPGPVWIWTPSEPPPVSSRIAGDWEGLTGWIGYKIESPALVTLQIQTYQATTTDLNRWWHAGFPWLLQAEFQMKDYRGEVTVDADLSPEGDDDAGPGKWTLRIPDGAPFSGQVVFGNTGGWISNRPRIFPAFTPPPNHVPTF